MIAARELEVQRKITLAFIAADAAVITLTRGIRVSDGKGGTIDGSEISLGPQTFRLIPSQDGSTERLTADGKAVSPEYILMGRWDADMARGDTFLWGSREYEVTFINENRQYETKGEVAYLGS